MELISGLKGLKPSGHYSPMVINDGLAYISGQFSTDLETGEKLFGTVGEEATRILNNIEQYLLSVGSDRNKIVKTIAYVADVELWGEVNQAYADFFGEHRPARCIVPVGPLHHGFKIEIEAIASVK